MKLLKNFTGCKRRVISKFFVSKCCRLHGQSLRENVYSFGEVLIQWSTHFSEILFQWSTHLVMLETAWVRRKQSNFIWTFRRSLWYSYCLITPVQLCILFHIILWLMNHGTRSVYFLLENLYSSLNCISHPYYAHSGPIFRKK